MFDTAPERTVTSATSQGTAAVASSARPSERLRDRILRTQASIGVIGLGYVGLAEAVEFASAGFSVVGFDVNTERVAAVQTAQSYLVDLTDEDLHRVVSAGRLQATGDLSRLAAMDAIVICVPTPLGKTKAPDLSCVLDATASIRVGLRPGQLIVLESTTYPGTTSEILLTALSSSGLRVGEDFHLCFSPERLNPGDKSHPPTSIPRIVGGVTPACAEIAAMLYRRIAPSTVTVSSTETAEMVKLLENTFRAVNIGLANELALLCRTLGLDVWEVIDAAATKPFGFMPFYPGPGLGGHCIPIDPLYLSWKARINGFEPRFIDLAHQVNTTMPRVIVSIVSETLNSRGRSLKGSNVLVVGVAYKRDVNDTRESPALEIMDALARRGTNVAYHDPYVPWLRIGSETYHSVELGDDVLRGTDCALILTNHTEVDYKRVVEYAPLVVDTRNATSNVVSPRTNVVRL